jgi:hypothetical protein
MCSECELYNKKKKKRRSTTGQFMLSIEYISVMRLVAWQAFTKVENARAREKGVLNYKHWAWGVCCA